MTEANLPISPVRHHRAARRATARKALTIIPAASRFVPEQDPVRLRAVWRGAALFRVVSVFVLDQAQDRFHLLRGELVMLGFRAHSEHIAG